MSRSAQLALPSFSFSKKLSFGGSALTSHPKTARPVVTKQAMHLVLRSTHAKGAHSFLKQERAVEALLRKQASQHGVRLYDLANAGNHLHIVARFPSRRAYRSYLRAISGLLVRLSLGVKRGQTLASVLGTKAKQFWDARPFSRIVSWGRDYSQLKTYLELNRVETNGTERSTARLFLKIYAKARRHGLIALGFDDVVTA